MTLEGLLESDRDGLARCNRCQELYVMDRPSRSIRARGIRVASVCDACLVRQREASSVGSSRGWGKVS
jgi:hypothetical protein